MSHITYRVGDRTTSVYIDNKYTGTVIVHDGYVTVGIRGMFYSQWNGARLKNRNEGIAFILDKYSTRKKST